MNLFTPAEIAKNYVNAGKGKVNLPISKMFLLAIMAGAFIAIGGISSTTAAVSVPLPSVAKFLSACIFPGGLTMVLLAGSELFTGNCLLTIPLLEKEITMSQMLKNWIVVYIGNFVGSLLVHQELSLAIQRLCLAISLLYQSFLQRQENVHYLLQMHLSEVFSVTSWYVLLFGFQWQ